MKRLLGTERNGGRVDRYWQHWGDDGKKKITVETVEDGEIAIKRAKRLSQHQGRDMRYVASIPATMIDEVSKIEAQRWGVSVKDAFAEIVAARTDRAKRVWRTLTQGRDFSRLQAKSYR